jgi:ribulose-phosphate 3-epimerase
MVHVSASLLAADLTCLGDEVRRAEQAGVDSFHFDLMDGHYVPNLAFSPDHLAALRQFTSLPFTVHLELNNPDYLLENFRPLTADLIAACLNTLPNPLRTLTSIRQRGAQAGLSLNPNESLDKISDLLPVMDTLILLGVHPGFGGQPMQADTPKRAADAARMRDQLGLQVMISVDGGVNQKNAPALVEAGADVLIIGTALFKSANMADVVKGIKAFS